MWSQSTFKNEYNSQNNVLSSNDLLFEIRLNLLNAIRNDIDIINLNLDKKCKLHQHGPTWINNSKRKANKYEYQTLAPCMRNQIIMEIPVQKLIYSLRCVAVITQQFIKCQPTLRDHKQTNNILQFYTPFVFCSSPCWYKIPFVRHICN